MSCMGTNLRILLKFCTNNILLLLLLLLLLLAIRINTFYELIWWCRTNIISPSSGRIRAPPAKRPLLLHLRSIGKCCFSLRLFCFSRSGCRGVLGCTSKRSWYLVLLSFRTSLMNGIPRSLWSVKFDTYGGAFAIDQSILGWQYYQSPKTALWEWYEFIFVNVKKSNSAF